MTYSKNNLPKIKAPADRYQPFLAILPLILYKIFAMLLEKFWVEVLISNIVAFILLLAAIYRPRTARILFSLLFVWAAFTNWFTVHNKPQVYLEYESMALLYLFIKTSSKVFLRSIQYSW